MNWDLVKEAVVEEGAALRADPYQQEDALGLCERAADRWWETDKDLTPLGVEYRYDFTGWEADSSGVIDLWGRSPEGLLTVIDWKVTRKVDDTWAGREERSRQALEYALALLQQLGEESVYAEYRGISYDDGKTRVVSRMIEPHEVSGHECEAQAWSAVRNDMVERHGWSGTWPRNWDGCYAMGPYYPCEYLAECKGGGMRPAPEGLGLRRMSHSSRKDFRRCPELYRLKTIDREEGRTGKDSDASRLGRLVHAGLAALYRQRG